MASADLRQIQHPRSPCHFWPLLCTCATILPCSIFLPWSFLLLRRWHILRLLFLLCSYPCLRSFLFSHRFACLRCVLTLALISCALSPGPVGWERILVITCFRSKNVAFLYCRLSQAWNLTTIPHPTHSINYLNCSSGRIKWLRIEEKMVYLYLISPYWLKGLDNSPPYSLWNHAPISYVAVHS